MTLADFLTGLPVPNFEVGPGFADDYPNVRVRGLVQPAIWLGDYAAKNEPIIVGLIGGKTTGQYLVLGRVGGPLPVEGVVTAAPSGSDTITVSAADTDYVVTFLDSYTPVVGDRVGLLWQGAQGRVLGKVGVTPSVQLAPPATAPPPGAATSGALPVVATDSATYSGSLYGWNQRYGQSVYQGDGSPWGGPSVNSGSWFYGSGAGQLAGATVTGVQFRLPGRNTAGASGAGTVHLYLHTSPSRPGGDVTRIDGPHEVSSTEAGNYVTLPTAWGANLVAGGGISISGNPYMGFRGRGEDPASGQLSIQWQR